MHTGVQKIKFRKVYKINEKFYTSYKQEEKLENIYQHYPFFFRLFPEL